MDHNRVFVHFPLGFMLSVLGFVSISVDSFTWDRDVEESSGDCLHAH